MESQGIAQLPRPLLSWYALHARDLPWRETPPVAYHVWVSEIMLQQTRVAAVLDYYRRFLEAFPSVEALADAPEEKLLKCWEGLGYYSRARNLQKAAREIVSRFGGVLPQSREELLTLPGIGDYTAGAIASIAYGRPEPAVDGNLLRVVSRLEDSHENVLDPRVKRAVTESLRTVMPQEEAEIRLFNQALMDLGAMVCLPGGTPRCEECPLAPGCLGHLRGTAAALPVRAAKKSRRTEELTVFVLARQGKVALRRRPETGLLASLWEFPNLPGALTEEAVPAALAPWGLDIIEWKSRLAAKHIFTHVEWHMTGYALEVTGDGPPDLVWVDGPGLLEHAVPSAFARYYDQARALLGGEKGD